MTCDNAALRPPLPPSTACVIPHFLALLAPLVAVALLTVAAPSWAQMPTVANGEPPSSEVSGPEAGALADALKDPQERQALISQLELMAEAQADQGPQEPSALDATGELLKRLSQKAGALSGDFVAALAGVRNLSGIADWISGQLASDSRRALWSQVLLNLALTIGLGYAALYLLRLGLLPLRRRLGARAPERFWMRLPLLTVTLLLDVIPIIAFGAVAYLILGYLGPRSETRLVALAWIQAVILAQLVAVFARAVFAAWSPQLRVVPMDDAPARSADHWLRAFAQVGIYGYFAIQAAALLGLPKVAANASIRLLGFVILLMLMALVLRLRKPVERWIRGRARESSPLRDLRVRLASVWYVPALLYLVVLYTVWALDVMDGSTLMLRGTLLSVVIVTLAAWLAQLLDQAIRRALRPSDGSASGGPALRSQLRRYRPALQTLARWSIAAAALILILRAWGAPSFAWITQGPGSTLIGTILTLLVTVVGAIVIWEGATHAISSYLAKHDDQASRTGLVRSARARTLLSVARTALLIVLSVVTVLMVLTELGVDIAPMLAAAGVVGLAVGFGAQKLVQDLITGFFFLLEDTFAVGDVIQVGDRSGLVESVTIRNVRLRDLAGTVHTIPFSTIDKVSNLTMDYSCFVFDIGVGYREDVDQVMSLLREIGRELRADQHLGRQILDDIEVFGLDAFGDSAVVIKGRIKTRPGKQWEVGRELNRRVKARFDALDIEIPFPHRTLYLGADKDGSAPPLWVRAERLADHRAALETGAKAQAARR